MSLVYAAVTRLTSLTVVKSVLLSLQLLKGLRPLLKGKREDKDQEKGKRKKGKGKRQDNVKKVITPGRGTAMTLPEVHQIFKKSPREIQPKE